MTYVTVLMIFTCLMQEMKSLNIMLGVPKFVQEKGETEKEGNYGKMKNVYVFQN